MRIFKQVTTFEDVINKLYSHTKFLLGIAVGLFVIFATDCLRADDVKVIAVTAGKHHSLFITSDGNLWAMGDNQYGQLGDGSTTKKLTPVHVASNVIAAAAGGDHSLFITSDGKLWAMGRNSEGELGDGTTKSQSKPVYVASDVVAITAGGRGLEPNFPHTYLASSRNCVGSWRVGLGDKSSLLHNTFLDS